MPPARLHLLDAASSYALGSEDRLTELFAVALSLNEPLARALGELVGLRLCNQLRVTTQLKLASGRHARPDMQLAAHNADGDPAWLWIENKIWAPLTDAQARGYPAELHGHRAIDERRLILIAADQRDQPVGWDAALTWQRIGLLVDQVARVALGEHWRTDALAPTAETRWRILAELLWYLEDRDLAMTEPLTEADAEVFRHLARVTARLEALLITAVPLVSRVEQNGLRSTDDHGIYQNFRPSSRDWIRGKDDAYVCLELAPYAYWLREEPDKGTPYAAAGYALPHAYYDSAQVALAEHDLAARGLTLWSEEGEDVLIYASWPLRQLIASAASISEQAAQLATWANSVLDELTSLRVVGLRKSKPQRGTSTPRDG